MNLSFRHPADCIAYRPDYLHVPGIGSDRDRFCKEEISDQHGSRISPDQMGDLPAPADIRPVHKIIMKERGCMEIFKHHRDRLVVITCIAAQPCR